MQARARVRRGHKLPKGVLGGTRGAGLPGCWAPGVLGTPRPHAARVVGFLTVMNGSTLDEYD
eukprot:2131080-Prymnesium_polylepis.1